MSLLISHQPKKINGIFIDINDFSADEIVMAQRIQRKRLLILVHSRLYYKLYEPVVLDFQYDRWAYELVRLQTTYPDIAKRVCFNKEFEDFDGCTGMDLPLDHPWVVFKANQILDDFATIGRRYDDSTKKKTTANKGFQQVPRIPNSKGHRGQSSRQQRVNALFKR